MTTAGFSLAGARTVTLAGWFSVECVWTNREELGAKTASFHPGVDSVRQTSSPESSNPVDAPFGRARPRGRHIQGVTRLIHGDDRFDVPLPRGNLPDKRAVEVNR